MEALSVGVSKVQNKGWRDTAEKNIVRIEGAARSQGGKPPECEIQRRGRYGSLADIGEPLVAPRYVALPAQLATQLSTRILRIPPPLAEK